MTVKILVGTPAYGGQITTAYFRSAFALTDACRKNNAGLMFYTMDKESLISRGRNTIVAEFLGRPDFTHLLFIDADIGFQPSTVFRMLRFDKPVCGAAYPMKNIHWDRVMERAKAVKSAEELQELSANFAVNVFDEDNAPKGAGQVKMVNGFVRVSKLGTGFMMIQRHVFEKLIARYPEKKYVNDISAYDNKYTKGNFWGFFDPLIHPQSRRYLSEDFGFCHLWAAGCGGEMWCDITSRMTHFGIFEYTGRYIAGKKTNVMPAKPGRDSAADAAEAVAAPPEPSPQPEPAED